MNQLLVEKILTRPSNRQVALSLLLIGAAASSVRAQPTVAPAEQKLVTDVISKEQWQQVDHSVMQGLVWLAGRQQKDGSFPTLPQGQPGLTSLCILAFLAQGELPDEGKYGALLSQAIEYSLKCQKANGLLSLIGPAGNIDPTGPFQWEDCPGSYNHAITSLMLSEVYAMADATQVEKVRAAIEKSTLFSLRLQKSPKRETDQGGWRYLGKYDLADSDLSVTSWYLMSLRSAKNAGFDVPDESIKEAIEYVLRCFSDVEETFLYPNQPREKQLSRAMAGAGILALAHGGRHDFSQAQAAGDWLLAHKFRNYNGNTVGKERYHYGMFYSCRAMYQLGGTYWQKYFPSAVEQLVPNQQSDGSWNIDANRRDRRYGRCYTTALSILALSAPNQLLPIFQR